MNIQITIDQLKNYLGTGLMIRRPEWIKDVELYASDLNNYEVEESIMGFKPLCYRLSDLDKLIPELGFVPLDELYFEAGHSRDLSTQKSRSMYTWKKSMMTNIEMLTHYELDFWILSKLFKWHFWTFGEEYFDQGLVIDKLKLQCTR